MIAGDERSLLLNLGRGRERLLYFSRERANVKQRSIPSPSVRPTPGVYLPPKCQPQLPESHVFRIHPINIKLPSAIIGIEAIVNVSIVKEAAAPAAYVRNLLPALEAAVGQLMLVVTVITGDGLR